MLDNLKNININHIQGENRTKKPLGSTNISFEKYNKEASFSNPVFSGNLLHRLSSYSKIQDPKERKMYNKLYDFLDKPTRANLEMLLKTGRLLNKDSADGSSTLQNLYKIAFEPRAMGLSNKKILDETIKTLVNPFIITQKFGKIPDFLAAGIVSNEKQANLSNGLGLNSNLAPHFSQTKFTGSAATITPEDINVETSGTCVSASIEFNLADKKPAEFARYVAGLTSPDLSVKTAVNINNINPNTLEAISILNNFGIEHQMLDWNNAIVTLRPDRNAIIRARVQNSNQQPGTRSTIDTLLQSTFMQIGSANTYNSLSDKRAGEHIQDPKGLVEFEKDFVETVTGNKKIASLTYQIVDENGYLKGYNYDYATIQKHLLDALKRSSNIIVGTTQVDKDNKIIGGHEITIVGARQDKNGELYFIYNDTDDNEVIPLEIKAQDLIPTIHHAGLPGDIVNVPDKAEERAYELVNEFQRSRKTDKNKIQSAKAN